SYPYDVPSFFQHKRTYEREEFLWDISDAAGLELDKLSKNHKRNIKKAEKFQLSIQSGSDLAFLDAHIKMLGHSSERRFLTGGVREHYRRQRDRLERSLRSGHGKIWQAIYQGETVSSVLLLGSGPRRYYQSGGTSEAGMNIGASQWLFWNLTSKLREEGATLINLAGVSKGQEGLRRFKEGFNSMPVTLSNVYFDKFSDNKMGKVITLALKIFSISFNRIKR
ncbi:MAG: GNAT family N-acetyltransferase, partial [Bacteroidota bacterium]